MDKKERREKIEKILEPICRERAIVYAGRWESRVYEITVRKVKELTDQILALDEQ